MIIRQLERKDADSYRELRLEALLTNPDAFITTYEQEKQRPNPVESTASRLESDLSHTFGVFSEEKLVGNVTLMKETHPKFAHKASILAMYVSPDFRGKGAGEALLKETKRYAAEIELEILQLSVVTDNTAARKLYEKAGFHEYGVEHKAIKLPNRYLDELHMVHFIKN
ncbi:GNAT family N-acetyltransferase [Halobacillus shinanisalinarum]|uniref:GNAT family N-acetyltransferase n=1 Tax=Halobacillus shinanisalinarum TaxID=2932258 RepID=A0ABY4GXA9_9BACI|nr:GNAT family N-acetyltransferase [Halobacillus shinanisalinarum]UOQ92704.1 GNAT family N-acetyltransferase [Halobacillus shinanisalinarum]